MLWYCRGICGQLVKDWWADAALDVQLRMRLIPGTPPALRGVAASSCWFRKGSQVLRVFPPVGIVWSGKRLVIVLPLVWFIRSLAGEDFV